MTLTKEELELFRIRGIPASRLYEVLDLALQALDRPAPSALKQAKEALEKVSSAFEPEMDSTLAADERDALKDARAALASLSAATEVDDRWRPIESAPKDGTKIWGIEPGAPLGWDEPHQAVMRWELSKTFPGRGSWIQDDNERLRCAPTHWQPFPIPPGAA